MPENDFSSNQFTIYAIIKSNSSIDRYHIKLSESGDETTRMLSPGPWKQTCHQDDTFNECYCRHDYVPIYKVPENQTPFFFSVTATDEIGGLHKIPPILIEPNHPSKRAFIKINIVKIDDLHFELRTSD